MISIADQLLIAKLNSLGPAPICRKCNVPVQVTIREGILNYACHEDETPAIPLSTIIIHPEKTF